MVVSVGVDGLVDHRLDLGRLHRSAVVSVVLQRAEKNRFFTFSKLQSALIKPVSTQTAQLGIFANFTSFIEMHFLQGPVLGHSMMES